MTPSRFEGKIVIVTGGSSGLGRAACVALAREGARLLVVGRNPARVEETLKLLGDLPSSGAHLGLSLDVRSEEDMQQMARRALDEHGRIDILIASAGISSATAGNGPAAVANLPSRSWDEIIDTNLKGIFLANRAVLGAMMRQGKGEILNVASSLGMALGWAYASAYCASKFAVVGLTEALAEEARGFGVRVQALLPDAIDTPMLGRSRLAIPGSVSAEQTADLILEVLSAPDDVRLENPVIEPFGPWEKTGRRKVFAP